MLIIVARSLLSLPLKGLFLAALPACVFSARRALGLALLTALHETRLTVLIVLQPDLLTVGARLG